MLFCTILVSLYLLYEILDIINNCFIKDIKIEIDIIRNKLKIVLHISSNTLDFTLFLCNIVVMLSVTMLQKYYRI